MKEARLLLRRINKSIRSLDVDLSGTKNQLQIDTESLNQLSDLIYSKALGRVTNGTSTSSSSSSSTSTSTSACFFDEDPENILNELI